MNSKRIATINGRQRVVCSFCLKRQEARPQNGCPRWHKERYKEHQHRMSKYYRQHDGRLYFMRIRWKDKLGVISLLGGKCVGCGISDPRLLQVNHVNGGGLQEVKGLTTHQFYRKILKGERKTDDLNLLCANCNVLYEYERGKRYDGAKTSALVNESRYPS